MNSFKRNNDAYTMIEVMVVLVIIGILSSIAIPAFRNMLITSKISVATSTLHNALHFVRLEAIKRGRSVTICRSFNSEHGAPSCAAGAINPDSNLGWADGWIIFVDVDHDQNFGSSDILVRVQHKLFNQPGDGSIFSSPHRNQLTFNSTGQIFASYMRFTVSRPKDDPDVTHVKYLCLASGGRARVDPDGCVKK